MTRNKAGFVFLMLFLFALSAMAQKPKTPAKKPTKKITVQKKAEKPKTPVVTNSNTPHDISQDEKKVRDIVAFFEYMLNTIGSNSTSARDKDVLITQSYTKIFRDQKVQVEDDLDENRTVITNKDVMAYLKDVDFFFTDVKFEFIIDAVQSETNAENQLFYKVSLKRNLKGTTPDGKSINNTAPRYIEVNYNPQNDDLRIVSIYTNESNEKDAQLNWWKALSYEWQEVFKRKINHTDSVSITEINTITALEDLDLNSNTYIQSIEPLARLTRLKSLHLSHTNISDLTPIRNLTALTDLDLSYTPIQDLSSLKYADQLLKLNVSHTKVTDVSVVEKMLLLQHLDISHTAISVADPIKILNQLAFLNLAGTKINSFSALESLPQIAELNISQTSMADLTPIKGYKNLKTLVMDSTRIASLVALSSLDHLTTLYANHTMVADLLPLQKLPQLQKIYCDQTPVTRSIAETFMAANPKVLVVYDSKDLQTWWDCLSAEWQTLLSRTANISPTPSKDDLAKVTLLDSLNLAEQVAIRDLEPLRQLLRLKVIIANSGVAINDLSPLQEHREITYLDISNTEVNDVSVLRQFKKLKILRADKTKIENLDPLTQLAALEKIYVDQTPVHDILAQEFLALKPECLLVYKTLHLNRWWGMIGTDWKNVFYSQMKDTTTSRENLHLLVEQKAIHVKDVAVNDLSALSEFIQLRELHFSGTMITTIPPMENLKMLQSLHVVSSPLQQIEALAQFTELQDLDISNTPIDDLKIISGLEHIKRLNCAGTQIKKLDALEKLINLEYLDCSNTRVGQLDAIYSLRLKALKCYNTKLSARQIESYKKSHPDCNVSYYR